MATLPLIQRIIFKSHTKTKRETYKTIHGKKWKANFDAYTMSGKTGLITSITLKGKTVQLISDEEFKLISAILAGKWKAK